MIIPLPPFRPDRSVFGSNSSQNVVNALPVADGWGPMPGLTEISAALGSECRGAIYIRDSGGSYTIIAGTATGLYKLNTTDYTWTDISGTSAPYTLPTVDSWSFTVFGQYLIAHNISDVAQVYDITAGGVFADLAGSPPKAKYSWVSGDFLVFGYLEGTNGEKKVRWCGVNDIEAWTLYQKGADEQELPEGGEVMGGFGEQGGFYVINRSAIHFFAFAPSSGYTFTRTLINANNGAVSARSIVSIGSGKFFFLSEDGFFSGPQRQPIGAERVDRFLLSEIDMSYLGDVQGASDPFEKIIWWRYRKADGTYRRLGYDWQLDRWCRMDAEVGELVALTTPGVTWDGLATLYATIDDIDVPFDSRLFLGGRPTMATFTSANKLAFFTGANLAATIETAAIQPAGMTRSFLNGLRVMTDATGVSVTDTVYDYHGATGTESASSTVNRAGLFPMRSDGRLHKITVTIPAGTDWSIASGVDANFQASGEQ